MAELKKVEFPVKNLCAKVDTFTIKAFAFVLHLLGADETAAQESIGFLPAVFFCLNVFRSTH